MVCYPHLFKIFPQFVVNHTFKGFPGSSAGKKICLQCRRPWFYSWIRKIIQRSDRLLIPVFLGFLGSSDGKESACNAGAPGLGRSFGGGHGNPFQYSCLGNPHGQRSLVGYSPWGLQRAGLDSAQHSTAHATKSIFSDINMATPAFLSQTQ